MRRSIRSRAGPLSTLTIGLTMLLTPIAAAGLEVTVYAPPALAAAAARVRSIDFEPLERALAGAGLEPPAAIRITLAEDDDPRARRLPTWVVGQAIGTQDVAIFPQRISAYPYDSLESVVRHEIVHLTVERQAGGRGIPRWFHEGVAESVGSRRGLAAELRLIIAAIDRPAIRDVNALFRSDAQPEAALAYVLAAALIDDIRRRHGAAVPGAIAGAAGRGVPFERAFAMETGESADESAARAWAFYRGLPQWIVWATSPQTLWSAILALALVAIGVRLRQRSRRRRQMWDEDDL